MKITISFLLFKIIQNTLPYTIFLHALSLPLTRRYSPPEHNPTFLLTQKWDQMYMRNLDTIYPYSIYLTARILLLYYICLFTIEYFTE